MLTMNITYPHEVTRKNIMSTLDQLMQGCASALHRAPWEVQKHLTYLQEKQLLTLAKDVSHLSIETIIAWGVPMRLGLEMKYQSGIFSKRPMLLYAVHRWLNARGKRKDTDEWSVSSDDVKFSSFRLEPTAHTRAKDFITSHIQTFLTKFRLRRKTRLDATCEVAQWLGNIAIVLSRPESEIAWRKFLVTKHWLRTIQDLSYVPDAIWQSWSVQGHIPYKVALMLGKLESVALPFKFPVLPSTVKRSAASLHSAGSANNGKSKLAVLPKSTSVTTASFSGSEVASSAFTSSLKTLQDKLLEFTAKSSEDEPSWLVRNFQVKATCEKKQVTLSFNRRNSRWFLDVRLPSGELHKAVNLLTVSKVARPKDDRYVLVKHQEGGDTRDLVIECDECPKVSKSVRKVINWVREQSFIN